MSCLICLRNEGIHLLDENANDWEILLQLFKLPQQLMEDLKGNECCSVCRVKFQFVRVLTEELKILNGKKIFKEEVKEIFVASFNNNQMNIENEKTIESRNKLLKELQIPIEDVGLMKEEISSIEFDSENERQLYNYELTGSQAISDPLESNLQFNSFQEEEKIIDTTNNEYLIEVEQNFETKMSEIANSSNPITQLQFESPQNFQIVPPEIPTTSTRAANSAGSRKSTRSKKSTQGKKLIRPTKSALIKVKAIKNEKIRKRKSPNAVKLAKKIKT